MMNEEDLTEEEIEQLQELTGQQGYGYPKPPKKEDVFTFFKHILGLKKSDKVANYTNVELGTLRLPARAYLDIASYAKSEKLDTVAEYLENKAEIIAGTSMGRKGFFTQMAVTQIKREQKIKPPEEKKGGWFSGNKKSEEENLGGGL